MWRERLSKANYPEREAALAKERDSERAQETAGPERPREKGSQKLAGNQRSTKSTSFQDYYSLYSYGSYMQLNGT